MSSTSQTQTPIPSLEFLTFEGRDDEDVTLFLRNVNRVAFSQGRQRDDNWTCDYLQTCLAGRALRFFAGLDESVQISWKSLRQAFLDQFDQSSIVFPPSQPPPQIDRGHAPPD